MAEKIIFVTGAASGIGKYVASKLSSQGYRLLLADIDEEGGKNLLKDFPTNKAYFFRLNVTNPQEWENVWAEAKQKWGKIDVLMNIAGVCKPNLVEDTSLESINSQIDINLKGTIFGTRIASVDFIKQKSGQIINVSSIAGITAGIGFNVYNASKFGVRGFTLSVAYELRKHNIFVSLVCPDIVDTPLLTAMQDTKASALAFGSKRPLTVQEVGDTLIYKALEQKKLEIIKTLGFRKILIRLGGIFPSLGLSWIANKILQKGEENRKKFIKKK